MPNPYLPLWEYIPDGEPRVFGNRVYVYGSHDRVGHDQFCDYVLKCWSAPVDDLGHWTDHGVIFRTRDTFDHPADTDWTKEHNELYAPDVVEKDGKYYLFAYIIGAKGCVAVSDRPEGPFTLLGRYKYTIPDSVCVNGWFIDPGVLVDDDGQVYIACGFERSFIAKIEPQDMTHVLDGTYLEHIIPCEVTENGGFTDPDSRFYEAASLRKIGDTYYFSYCSNWETRSEEYADLGLCSIGYMTSKNPEGPYTFRGDVLINCGNVFKLFGNNHHSITQFRGKYYMFYHTRVLEEKLGSELGFRSCHVNELTVNDDGTLAPVQQDLAGVSQIKDFDPYRTNLGITYSNCAGMLSTRYLTDGSYMQAVSDPENYDYSWSLVKGVQFGTDGASNFTAHFKMTAGTTAQIKVYTDALGQNEIASADIVPDESGNATISVPVSKLTDKHDLYFAFKGDVLSFEDWSFQK